MKSSTNKPSNTRERLSEIMTRRNIKASELLRLAKPWCERYGVKLNKSDISQYLSGKTEPTQDKLVILGRTLGVCEVWLMGYDVDEVCNQPAKPTQNTPEESLLIRFRKLDDMDKERILERIDTMLESEKYGIEKEFHIG